MKQTIFMVVMTLLGTVGVFTISPFCGVGVYYFFAVLRPQFMWDWALPPGIQWSFYVAVTTIGAGVLVLLGAIPAGVDPQTHRPLESPRWRLTHFWMMAFGAWLVITFFTAQNRDASYMWFIEYCKIFTMFVISSFLICTMRQVWILLVITALTLGYIAYEINFLYLAYGHLGIYHSGYGGLDNNGAGTMLAMGIPICYVLFESTNRWWRWIFVLLIPVTLHAVLMTYSRGAMVSLVAASPFLFWRSRYKKMFILFGIVLLFMLPYLAGKEIQERFLTISEHQVDESANSRRMSWMAAIRIAQDYPIFGVGIRNSPLFSYYYGADMPGRVIHSQYFQVLADNGFVGLGLYLITLFSLWLSLRRLRNRFKKGTDLQSRQAVTIANAVEASGVVFCTGAVFLSLEIFELPYLLILLGAQASSIGATLTPQFNQPPGNTAGGIIPYPGWNPQYQTPPLPGQWLPTR